MKFNCPLTVPSVGLQSGKCCQKQIRRVAGVSFQVEDGVLNRLHAKSKFATVQTTIAVPESLRQLVLSYAHESDLADHSSFQKTLSAIRTRFSWPGVCSDVKNYTTSCHLCQIKPRTGRDRPAPFQPVPIVGEPFERVMIDLVGPLLLSSDRYEYLLTLVDVSSRWAEAVPLHRITAKDVAEALFSIFVKLGFPMEIQSDRGQQFMSKLLAEFNSLCNIKRFVSTPYHPQTNRIVERFHSTLKSMIRKLAYCVCVGHLQEDGGEIGSLVTTPPLVSESGTVAIDLSLTSSQVQPLKELLIECTVAIDLSLTSSQVQPLKELLIEFQDILSYLRAGSPKNARLMRWALALQEFSFQVVLIPGSENVHADVLSRLC
ncbi:Pol polyprotein [Plakobranchus ocellatus]|uniref:Pol polyprotein n=1 Tax=Plakobranchus ocellatus TaxID=259542 RepID=A0AAV4BYR4_9GAST|nr:Pol polyprotein [Plakobranchus ocellatus]